ncbi:UNVERIFIED_CONTAM: hypothetical protein K2H54_072529 [Gekko kuhli]
MLGLPPTAASPPPLAAAETKGAVTRLPLNPPSPPNQPRPGGRASIATAKGGRRFESTEVAWQGPASPPGSAWHLETPSSALPRRGLVAFSPLPRRAPFPH